MFEQRERRMKGKETVAGKEKQINYAGKKKMKDNERGWEKRIVVRGREV